MKIKCRGCAGSRKRMGMGGMVKDCDVCNKTGWVEKEVLEPTPVLDEYEPIPLDEEVSEIIDTVENAQFSLPKFEVEVVSSCAMEDIFPGIGDASEEFTEKLDAKKKGRPKKK